ncbi:hypothetical protein CEXT_395051 [Caerostris extrusa]|uniref:Uncharacterized protein n=1 Tax=Caerostris extrusa TaxID=172846 RepID=A0AAV4YGQ8_CAEEX|nr:hypothetical protein CEXT_395051 [Caerostris extrusa]
MPRAFLIKKHKEMGRKLEDEDERRDAESVINEGEFQSDSKGPFDLSVKPKVIEESVKKDLKPKPAERPSSPGTTAFPNKRSSLFSNLSNLDLPDSNTYMPTWAQKEESVSLGSKSDSGKSSPESTSKYSSVVSSSTVKSSGPATSIQML